ncbi:MAG: hypothetical protein MJ239_02660 [Bacilli bacterium]|nr:hypothetical protein [Bacilli bacterium]
MSKVTLLFKANPMEEDLFANVADSPFSDYLSDARTLLSSLRKLEVKKYATYYPDTYEEDLVQIKRREEFSLTDWILVAITVDFEDTPTKALIINRNAHKEGYVVDLRSRMIESLFFRGFTIKEDPDAKELDEDAFLESIGVEKEKYVAPQIEDERPIYVEEDEDGEVEYSYVAPLPVFEAQKKGKIVNFGGYEAPIEVEAYEDEDGELYIDVEKPTFQAGNSKKPRNLNATPDRPKYKKAEPIYYGEQFETPAFVPGSSKKPRNLNATPDRPKKVVPVAPKTQEKQGSIEVERPTFTPSSNKKPQNLEREKKRFVPKEDKPVSVTVSSIEERKPVEKPAFEADSKKKIKNYDEEAKKILREWKEDSIYRLRPDVYRRERGVILNLRKEGDATMSAAISLSLSKVKNLAISSKCLFVPNILDDGDPRMKAIYHFDPSKFSIICLSVNEKDEPLLVALNSNEEKGFVLVLSMKEPVMVEVVSTKGISLDDPALPFFDYESLLKFSK